jgi:vancomycin resistance protein YoaR
MSLPAKSKRTREALDGTAFDKISAGRLKNGPFIGIIGACGSVASGAEARVEPRRGGADNLKELNKRGGVQPARRYDSGRKGGKRYAPRGPGRGRLFARRLLGVGLLVGVIVLLAFVAVNYLTTGEGEIRNGVEVGGLDVGGMTRDEARTAISDHAATTLGEIELVDGEDRFTLPGEDLGIKVDAAAAAEEAYAVGRGDGIFQRVAIAAGMGGEADVAAAVDYDEEAARAALKGLAEEFDRDPKDASFSVAGNGEVEVVEGQSGRVLDAGGTLANLDRTLDEFGGEVALVAQEKRPALTTEEARALGPKQLIGEYKTDFAWDPDEGRQANIRMASEAVNNTLLAPGETFSFTEQAGMLDYEKAKVFTDGGVAYEEGGGLCQVSSTLFMAANYAGLEIVERHPHYAELPYIKPGFDATVWFGDWNPMDMRFKNTTDGYVLVREFVDEDGYLNAQILGQKPTGNKVIMNTEKISQSTSEGIKWITYKKIVGADGEVLFDDVMYEGTYSWNPPTPAALEHETNEPRVSGWLDPGNTTGWSEIE